MKKYIFSVLIMSTIALVLPTSSSAQSVSQKYVQEQQAAKKKQADLVKQSTQKKLETPKR